MYIYIEIYFWDIAGSLFTLAKIYELTDVIAVFLRIRRVCVWWCQTKNQWEMQILLDMRGQMHIGIAHSIDMHNIYLWAYQGLQFDVMLYLKG